MKPPEITTSLLPANFVDSDRSKKQNPDPDPKTDAKMNIKDLEDLTKSEKLPQASNTHGNSSRFNETFGQEQGCERDS